MTPLAAFEAVIDASGVAPAIEAMLPVAARARQLKVRTLLAGVPRPAAIVLLIAQVRGELGLQRPLQHRPDQLAQHRALAGQPQPARLIAGPLEQRVQEPVVHQLPQRPPRRLRHPRRAAGNLAAARQSRRILADRVPHDRSPPEEPGHIPARGPITLSNQLPHLRKYPP